MKNNSLSSHLHLALGLMLGLLLFTSSVTAQECHTAASVPNGKAKDPGDPIGVDCDFMRYLPKPSDPETVIRVRFHIIQDDDGSDNFQPGDANLLAIESYLENHAFITVPPPVWPVLPPSQELSSSRIRFSIDDTYVYHQSSQHNVLGQVQNYAWTLNLSPEYIHVFLTEGGGNFGLGAFSNNEIIGQYGTWSTVTVGNGSIYGPAISLAHELGHSLGLDHTHNNPSPLDNFADTPLDPGCCGAPFYDPQDPNNLNGLNRSNNVMSYNWGSAGSNWMSTGRYLSPSQIAWMHYKINTSWQSQVVEPAFDPCERGAVTVIDRDTVWDTNKKLTGDLIVEPGVTLTVTCKSRIGVPDEAKTMVQNAGTLIVEDDSILTPSCGGMWQGVELWGDPTVPQVYNKGKLVLRDGGTIEHARTAVSTLRRTESGGVVWQSSGGGIIECDGGNFYDNARAVLMTPYTNTTFGGQAIPDQSYFESCRFYNMAWLRDPSYAISGYPVPVLSYVALWGVSGVSFNNVTLFPYMAVAYKPTVFFPEMRGTGILSLNASYSVSNSSLRWLSRGVDFYSQPLASQVTLTSNTFSGNEHGAVIEGGGPHLLSWNSYVEDIPNPVDPNVLIKTGMILRRTNGFSSHDNTHDRDLQFIQPWLSVGTVVEDSGLWGGSLYRNHYSKTRLGTAVVGDNWQATAECNSFVDNSVGMWINSSSPSGLPSTWGCAGSPTVDLGNTFLTSCSNLPQNGQHISIGGNTSLDYRLMSGAINPPDGSCSSNVTLNACGGGLQPHACPTIVPFMHQVPEAPGAMATKTKETNNTGVPEPNYLELSDEEVDQLRAQALAGDHFALGVLKFIGKADEELLLLPVVTIDWQGEDGEQ